MISAPMVTSPLTRGALVATSVVQRLHDEVPAGHLPELAHGQPTEGGPSVSSCSCWPWSRSHRASRSSQVCSNVPRIPDDRGPACAALPRRIADRPLPTGTSPPWCSERSRAALSGTSDPSALADPARRDQASGRRHRRAAEHHDCADANTIEQRRPRPGDRPDRARLSREGRPGLRHRPAGCRHRAGGRVGSGLAGRAGALWIGGSSDPRRRTVLGARRRQGPPPSGSKCLFGQRRAPDLLVREEGEPRAPSS